MASNQDILSIQQPSTLMRCKAAQPLCSFPPCLFYASANFCGSPMRLIASVFALTSAAQVVYAQSFKLGEVEVTLHEVVTYGTSFRAAPRDPRLLWGPNSAALGLPPVSIAGRNQDDGNLNYHQGDVVSSVIKGWADVEIKYHQVGALVRGKGWHDFSMSGDDCPWGNIANGLTANEPLSNRGFSDRAKFSGLALQDAYVYGNFATNTLPLYLRGGNQTIPWGDGVKIGGGLSAINPVDLPALHRPGALPEETRIPFPALFSRLDVTDTIKAEAFYQFLWEPSQRDGPGTFYSIDDATPDGSDKVFLGPGSDRNALTAGNYMKRAATPTVSDAGQFGLGLGWKAEAIKTDFGFYAARYHSRMPMVSAIKTGRAGGPVFVSGDPDGYNSKFFTEYPEGIAVFGATFATRAAVAKFYGELTHSPNQPFQLNTIDLLNGVVSGTAPSLLRADIDATPYGGVFHAYDRFGVSQLKLGATKTMPGILGAESLSFEAEFGLKYAHDLPEASVRRYGRADAYGIGPVGGIGFGDARQNSLDGYVTRLSSGYRLRSSLRYKNIWKNLDMLPSLVFGHDILGWSWDNVFSEGRMAAAVGLRAEYRQFYHVEISYSGHVAGGRYNNAGDRDVASVSAGLKF